MIKYQYKQERRPSTVHLSTALSSAGDALRPLLSSALDRIKKYGDEGYGISALFEELSEFCASAPKPVVLLIDEVDSASNNQVFLDILVRQARNGEREAM